MRADFCELNNTGLIGFSGDDAAAFLHAQLTSDVAGVSTPGTQYSGYCSPQGRLLATPFLWRLETEILLQLPIRLTEALLIRLSKYVMRARVKVSDASARYGLFGVAGDDSRLALAESNVQLPEMPHAVSLCNGIAATSLPVSRYLVLTEKRHAETLRTSLKHAARQRDEDYWSWHDIQAGIPVITADSQERYVPQMVNLDLIGGVSYSKGCYPGQEIVARAHYLGRIKQRMYRVRLLTADALHSGDALYSEHFGEHQACGTLLNAAENPQGGGQEALAVVQTSAAETGVVHWKSLNGPPLDFLPLPYAPPTKA